MSYEYLIDSSAWAEYFGGTQKGKKAVKIIERTKIATSIMAIVELADKFERENADFAGQLKFIQSRSAILPLTIEIALNAAKLKNSLRKLRKKFGIADAIHLAAARSEKAIVLTTDSDFRGIENTQVI